MQKILFPALLSAAALLSQTPQIVEEKQIHVIAAPTLAPAGAAGGFTFMSTEMGFETTLVKGVPFTGDFVTENIQALADGNRIKNTNTTAYARDGEGRTRREITIESIGPFTGNAPHKTVFIHDPVSKIDYILDPQNKTARKINLGAVGGKGMTTTTTTTREGNNVVFTRRMDGPDSGEMPRMPLPQGMVIQGQTGAVMAQRIQIGEGPAASTNFKNEDLGKRIIEGVEADGTRSTITIPAGQIGNDRPLDTVSERWFSNELKTVVMTTRKDPRMGESTYKLSNLRRGEPARILFEVPSDYKIVTEDNAGPNVFRMRIDKKQDE